MATKILHAALLASIIFCGESVYMGGGDQGVYYNVRDPPWNAAGNGQKNDTAAIQGALDAAGKAGGGDVFVPAGSYLVSSLYIPPHTTLRGIADAPPRTHGTSTTVEGTTLLAGDATKAFISMTVDSTLWGLAIYYPGQDPSATPKKYPPTIQGSGDDVSVRNVFLVNPWWGIDFSTHPCGRHLVDNVYGQPLYRGITVSQCYDIGRIRNIHFWPFWSLQPAVADFVQSEGIAFNLSRTDWEVIQDVFGLGYHVGLGFYISKQGTINGQITNANFDSTDICVQVEATQNAGVHINGLNCANDGKGASRIMIQGLPHKSIYVQPPAITINQASFWSCKDCITKVIEWSNPGLVTMTNSLLRTWNSSFPAIDILAGQASLRGNSFLNLATGGIALHVGENAGDVVVSTNQLNGNTLDVGKAKHVLLSNNQP